MVETKAQVRRSWSGEDENTVDNVRSRGCRERHHRVTDQRGVGNRSGVGSANLVDVNVRAGNTPKTNVVVRLDLRRHETSRVYDNRTIETVEVRTPEDEVEVGRTTLDFTQSEGLSSRVREVADSNTRGVHTTGVTIRRVTTEDALLTRVVGNGNGLAHQRVHFRASGVVSCQSA